MDSDNPNPSDNVSPVHFTAGQPSKAVKDLDNPIPSSESNFLCPKTTQIQPAAKQTNDLSAQPNNNPLPQAFELIGRDEDLLNAWKVAKWAFEIQNTPLPTTGKFCNRLVHQRAIYKHRQALKKGFCINMQPTVPGSSRALCQVGSNIS